MSLTFKRATTQDLLTIQTLSIETFSATFGPQNTPENLQAYLDEAYALDSLQAELNNHQSSFYLVFDGATLVGYLKLNIDAAQSEKMSSAYLEVERIYLKAAFQHEGFGRMMLDFAFQKASELGKTHIWLGVWEHNRNAQQFYQHLGFTFFGSHHFAMGTDMQTDLLMSREIAPSI